MWWDRQNKFSTKYWARSGLVLQWAMLALKLRLLGLCSSTNSGTLKARQHNFSSKYWTRCGNSCCSGWRENFLCVCRQHTIQPCHPGCLCHICQGALHFKLRVLGLCSSTNSRTWWDRQHKFSTKYWARSGNLCCSGRCGVPPAPPT